MGFEYNLKFNAPSEAVVAMVLARAGAAVPAVRHDIEVEFRAPESGTGGMPDALARAESGSVYFCVYGDRGFAYLGRVVAELASEFGAVEAMEL